MARYTGPTTKIARKFGSPIYGADKNFEKRNYPPGQHGLAAKRKKAKEEAAAAKSEEERRKIEEREEKRRRRCVQDRFRRRSP